MNMKGRKRAGLLIAAVFALAIGAAGAEMDLSPYSYEELQEIREQIDARMEELKRAYEIEHANRKFEFEKAETVIFIGRTDMQEPNVTPLDETAPPRTRFIWSSSNPEIAKIAQNGRVTAVSAGDAIITAEDEKGQKTFMIGTAGEGYTDQVIWVRSDPALVNTEVEIGSMATVYGLFHLETAYSEILQAETAVPAMAAEKILIEPIEP